LFAIRNNCEIARPTSNENTKARSASLPQEINESSRGDPLIGPTDYIFSDNPNQIFADTLNTDCIQPAAMIAGKERVRGFMVAMAVVAVLLMFLLLFAWYRRKGIPHQPEPPLHASVLAVCVPVQRRQITATFDSYF
jgi:hypothetical protein